MLYVIQLVLNFQSTTTNNVLNLDLLQNGFFFPSFLIGTRLFAVLKDKSRYLTISLHNKSVIMIIRFHISPIEGSISSIA